MTTTRWRLLATTLTLAALGCGDKPERRRTKATTPPAASTAGAQTPAAGGSAPAAASGWGSIKGKLVWGGADVPKQPEITVEKDKPWCTDNGKEKLFDETLVVNKDNKGVQNVIVFIKEAKAIHPDYPQTKADVEAAFVKKFEEEHKVKPTGADIAKAITDKKFDFDKVKGGSTVIDQVRCRYLPHALAVREGERTVVLNPEEIAHNVKVSSFKPQNNANPNMPPKTAEVFSWVVDANPLTVECSIHGWMKMFAMVFPHPYFVITGTDGSFELKNVPAGDLAIVLRSPRFIDAKTGGKGTAKGTTVTVKAGETLDLGEIKMQPE